MQICIQFYIDGIILYAMFLTCFIFHQVINVNNQYWVRLSFF